MSAVDHAAAVDGRARVTTEAADGVPVDVRLAAAQVYFPDRDEWASVRDVLGRLPFEALTTAVRPEAWRPVPPTARLGRAIAAAMEQSPFAAAVAGLLGPQLAEVEAALGVLAGGPVQVADGAGVGVLTDLITEHCAAWTRVLVAQMRAESGRGALLGPTPEARFDFFVERSVLPERLRLLAGSHPALLASSQSRVRGRAAQLGQITAGAEDLVEHFGARRIDRLAFGSGDSHAGGRSVCVLTCEDGRRVVHKPRAMALERAFYAFAGRLLSACGEEFVEPRIVERSDHAFMEFLQASNPRTPAEFRGYFRNLGRMAATVWLLDGHDVHHENVVALGTMPVPVDLECLFRGRTLQEAAQPPSATATIDEGLRTSVLGTLVLPSAIDIGGMVFQVGAGGMVARQSAPLRSFRVQNPGRDDMSITLERQVLEGGLTVPEVEDTGLPVHEVMTVVSEGVRSALQAARDLGEELVEYVDETFSDVRARFLNATSMGYGQLLRMLTHPSLSADAGRSALVASRAVLLNVTESESLLTAEIRDLLAGDVPLFEFTPDGREVRSWRGDLGDVVFAEPPKDRVIARLRGLDDDGIERQARLAASSFVAKLGAETEPTDYHLGAARAADGRVGPQTATTRGARLLAVARRIGDDLVASAVHGRDDRDVTNWEDIRITSTGEGLWTPGAMDQSVYGGFTGVATFLQALGMATGDRRYLETAASVFEPYARQCVDVDFEVPGFPVGATAGHAGVASAMIWYGRVADRAHVADAGWALLQHVATNLPDVRDDDHLSGIGGVLAVATARHGDSTDRRTTAEQVAHDCLRALSGRVSGDGLVCARFSGFAHGASGVLPYVRAWPQVDAAHPVATHLETALDDLLAEEGWHTSVEHSGRAYGWCHGSPGIALGELVSLELTGSADTARLDAALDLTRSECFGRTFGLCHGDLGTMEILLRAQELTGRRLVEPGDPADLVEHTDRHLRAARPPRGGYTRSVMVGTTGLGHAALRFLDRDLPPVLWQSPELKRGN
jgi:type 2 lantibiotic biosynthesis protein LanM